MVQSLRRLASEAWPEECAFLKESTDRFLNNIFLFNDPWDMEQCSIPVEFNGPINWDYQPADDPEWTYMLGRQSYVLLLARQAVLTGKKEYADKIAYFISDFIDRSPLTEHSKTTTWRTLDTGIRMYNWLSAWDMLDECGLAPVQILDKMKASLKDHINYMLSVDTPFLRLSNWGIIGNSGVYHAALFLGDEATASKMEQYIADELSIQVDPDGWHWEQSPMYHVEVLTSVLRVVRLAKRYGRTLPSIITESGLSMSLAVAKSAKPDHYQFMQGDSDDTDVRGLLTGAAILYESPELKFHGFSQPDFESLFWVQEDELSAFYALEAKPLPLLAANDHSGNYYLRTGWGEEDSCAHLVCGYMGSGHGHADHLHLDLCMLGKEVLCDSGRFTYVEKPIRLELKAPAAHNTFTMDGVPFTECTETWGYGEVALPMHGGAYTKNGWSFAEAAHLGYMRLADPAVCRRYVIQADKRLSFVLDLTHARAEHTYEGTYHFRALNGLRLEGDHAVYEAEGVVTEILYPGREAEVRTTPFSPHYNHLEDASCLVLHKTETGLCAMPTVFVSAKGEAAGAKIEELEVTHVKTGKVIAKDAAQAFRVTAFGEVWDFLFNFKDAVGDHDLLAAGSISGHGRVLAAHNGEPITLAW